MNCFFFFFFFRFIHSATNTYWLIDFYHSPLSPLIFHVVSRSPPSLGCWSFDKLFSFPFPCLVFLFLLSYVTKHYQSCLTGIEDVIVVVVVVVEWYCFLACETSMETHKWLHSPSFLCFKWFLFAAVCFALFLLALNMFLLCLWSPETHTQSHIPNTHHTIASAF